MEHFKQKRRLAAKINEKIRQRLTLSITVGGTLRITQ